MNLEQLEQLYEGESYYWGTEPNKLARKVLELVPERDRSDWRVVDFGAGEGRDSVFFAEHGFRVTVVELAANALRKAESLAESRGVPLSAVRADVNEWGPEETVHLVYSIGVLQYVRPERRTVQFAKLKEATVPGGLHVLFAFVAHPDVAPAPDWGSNEFLYENGELESFYENWETVERFEYVFTCHSSGVPHEHAAVVLVSRKPGERTL